jgi:hypothetical protein
MLLRSAWETSILMLTFVLCDKYQLLVKNRNYLHNFCITKCVALLRRGGEIIAYNEKCWRNILKSGQLENSDIDDRP